MALTAERSYVEFHFQAIENEFGGFASLDAGDAAVQACLAILVSHFYHLIFDPDIYPLNIACWDGRVSEEWQKHEHPLEVDEFAKLPSPAEMPDQASQPTAESRPH